MKKISSIFLAALITILFVSQSYAATQKIQKKKKKSKNGGRVLVNNPYGNSADWATIDLYSEPDFKGEHWIIDVYGTKLTIKNSKGETKKRFTNDFFHSAKIVLSTTGSVYLYDNNKYNREKNGNLGRVFLPSQFPRMDINDFDKEYEDKEAFGRKPSYKIDRMIKGKAFDDKKLGGNISSIIIKFNKMR